MVANGREISSRLLFPSASRSVSPSAAPPPALAPSLRSSEYSRICSALPYARELFHSAPEDQSRPAGSSLPVPLAAHLQAARRPSSGCPESCSQPPAQSARQRPSPGHAEPRSPARQHRRPLGEWWPSDRIDAGTPANELLPGNGRGEGDLVVDKGSPGRAEPHSPALQRCRLLGEWWPGDRIVRGSACSSSLTLQPWPARTCRKPRSPIGVRVHLHRRPQADRSGAGEGGQVRCVRRFDPDALHLVLYLYGCTYLPVELCC